jgi:hypothetical protein
LPYKQFAAIPLNYTSEFHEFYEAANYIFILILINFRLSSSNGSLRRAIKTRGGHIGALHFSHKKELPFF